MGEREVWVEAEGDWVSGRMGARGAKHGDEAAGAAELRVRGAEAVWDAAGAAYPAAGAASG